MTDNRLPIDKAPPKTKRRPDNSRTIDVPIDIHPGIVQGDHSALTVPRRAFETLHNGWSKLRDAASRVKDSDKLAREATTHTKRVLSSLAVEQEKCRAACTHLSQTIDAAVAPSPNDPMGSEIRQVIRDSKSPLKLVQEAVSNGDRRVVAAVLNAPPQLSGMTHAQLHEASQAARRTLEPADYSALEQMQSLANKLETYTDRFRRMADTKIAKWATGDDDALKELFGSDGG